MTGSKNEGWIRLYRQLLRSETWRALNNDQRVLLVTCLLKATHAPHQIEFGGKVLTLDPGQFVTSRETLMNECNLTARKTRTALKKLAKWQFLANETTNHGSTITVVNWANYQSSGTEGGQPGDQRPTSERPTDGQPATINKNGKMGVSP